MKSEGLLGLARFCPSSWNWILYCGGSLCLENALPSLVFVPLLPPGSHMKTLDLIFFLTVILKWKQVSHSRCLVAIFFYPERVEGFLWQGHHSASSLLIGELREWRNYGSFSSLPLLTISSCPHFTDEKTEVRENKVAFQQRQSRTCCHIPL